MSTNVLERLHANKVRGLENLVDSDDSLAAMTDEETQAAVADFYISEGMGLRESAMRLWEHNWYGALDGRISDRKDRGAELRASLEQSQRLLQRYAQKARELTRHSGEGEDRLAEFEEQCKSFRDWIEECMAKWELLDQPRKPLDREMVERSRQAFLRGEYEQIEDILARVKAGGPLVKE